jgi:hypothetical protein
MGRQKRLHAAWMGASLVVLAGAMTTPALAQQAPPVAAAEAATVYPPTFFATYNPITAADMVARIPGFELQDGDDRRGFGATAGNLLINGERPSSKTIPSELLKRIGAATVLRIELISGSSAKSDVRGQSQIVNVVLRPSAKRDSSTTYVLGGRYIQYSNRVAWLTQATRTMQLSDKADLSIDLQAPNLLGVGVSDDVIVNGGGTVTGTRFQVGQPRNMGLQGAASLNWRPTPRDSVHVNLQYAPTWNTTESIQYEYLANGSLKSSLLGLSSYDNNYTGEFGGDWEHRFSPTVSLKLIGLISTGNVDQHDAFDTYTAPSTYVFRTQDRTTAKGERIGRAQFKWQASSAHTLEFGGEGAFNFRDTTLKIVNTPQGGVPTPVVVPVANARVEEVRGEAFVTDIWTVSPKLTLETGLNFEVSRITQTGDQAKERAFSYAKPRIAATYVIDPKNTLRLRLQRDVAQLDFAEFSSAIDFVNTASIQGNPNLEPEKAWKSRLEWETRFAARSALTLALFADAVEDVHDLVVIGGLDAYGNIGDGTRVGAEIRSSFPLARFGLPNSDLRISGLYQQTRVTDPITGQRRSFSVPLERQGTPSGAPVLNAGNKDWAYVVNYRQNMPKLSSSWGAIVTQWSARDEYRRAESYNYVRKTPRLDFYVETTAWKPVTLRVYVNNILVSTEDRIRTFYSGDRSSNLITKTEYRDAKGGPEGSRSIGIQISGKL